MIKAEHLDSDFLHSIKNYRCGSGTFRMNVALDELPDFTCKSGTYLQSHHCSGIIIAPNLSYMEKAYFDAREFGWSKKPIVEMLIPSTIDPTLAPDGKHVASLFCQHFNPHLPHGNHWGSIKESVSNLILQTVNEYAPNF